MRHLFSAEDDHVKYILRPKVARSHFHEDVIILDGQQKVGSHFIKSIASDLALTIGLTKTDRILNTNMYYNVPNLSITDMEAFNARKYAQREGFQRGTISKR